MAERLFTEHGVAGVTTDDISGGRGRQGELCRRFSDKGGLAVPLLDERERQRGCRRAATVGNAAARRPSGVAALGDLQYESGTTGAFAARDNGSTNLRDIDRLRVTASPAL